MAKIEKKIKNLRKIKKKSNKMKKYYYTCLENISEKTKNLIKNSFKPMIGSSHITQMLLSNSIKPLDIINEEYGKYWGVLMQNKVLNFISNCFNLKINGLKYIPITEIKKNYSDNDSDSNGYIQSSCDGVILNNQILGYKKCFIEIKCPINGFIPIKMRPKDYIQIQSHLSAPENNNSACLYIVWSMSGIIINLVKFDSHFFNEILNPYLIQLYSGLKGMNSSSTNNSPIIKDIEQLKSLQNNSIEKSVIQICRCFYNSNSDQENMRNNYLHWFINNPQSFFKTDYSKWKLNLIQGFGDKIYALKSG